MEVKKIKNVLVPVFVLLQLFPWVNIILSQACGPNWKLQLIDPAEHPGTQQLKCADLNPIPHELCYHSCIY